MSEVYSSVYNRELNSSCHFWVSCRFCNFSSKVSFVSLFDKVKHNLKFTEPYNSLLGLLETCGRLHQFSMTKKENKGFAFCIFMFTPQCFKLLLRQITLTSDIILPTPCPRCSDRPHYCVSRGGGGEQCSFKASGI